MLINETRELMLIERYTYTKENINPNNITEITLSKVTTNILNNISSYYEVFRQMSNSMARCFTYNTLEEAEEQFKYLRNMALRKNGIKEED